VANTPNNPRDFSMKIKSTSETAFQRSIWGCKTSEVGGTVVTWLDIELPVDRSGNPRGQCVDLIGRDDTGRFVLCELKFGDPGNGSPEEAAEQVRLYKDEVVKNANCLGHHKKSEERGVLDWAMVATESTRLIVAANRSYWEYWRGRLHSIVPNGVECYELPIDSSCFKDQKPADSSYTPAINDEQNKWYPVVD